MKSARVDLASGRLLEPGEGLEGLAAAAPSLLDEDAPAALVGEGALLDVVILAPGAVYVAQRSRRDPNLALVSLDREARSLGVIVAEARMARERLDGRDGEDGDGRR
jgi:hypothetical protein